LLVLLHNKRIRQKFNLGKPIIAFASLGFGGYADDFAVERVNALATLRGMTFWRAIAYSLRRISGGRPTMSFVGDRAKELNESLGDNFFLRAATLDDRSLAIVVTSMLDRFLALAVITRFGNIVTEKEYERVFEGTGPLSGFAAKISLCSVLGIVIGEMNHDLTIMRKIRNDFAHEVADIDFTKREISSRCRSMKMSLDLNAETAEAAKTVERQKFLASGAAILFYIAVVIQRAIIVQTIAQERSDEINQRTKLAMEEVRKKSAPVSAPPALPEKSP
jgi:DNA-binding MltR family transcriptional regulator